MTAAEFRFWIFFVLFWLGVAGVYAVSCWLWPFKAHSRCEGSGKLRRKDGKVFKLCKRCKGTGRTLRMGRRAYNYLNRNRVEAR